MKGKLLAFGVSLLAVATIGVVQLQTKAVDGSRDCDQYAVIRCGTQTGAELRKEYDTNNASPANGSTEAQGDIKKIFSSMGISKSELSGFTAGVVYRDGTVKVDGKVVATNAQMAARGLGGTQIAGTNAQKVSVSAMSEAQTALVKLDANGKFLFAVMKPCGNPVTATPKKQPQPEPEPEPEAKAECVSLKLIEQERTKFLATTKAKVSNGAKIKSYSFTVAKDGNVVYDNTYPSTAAEQSVVYVVNEPGDYKVTSSVQTSEGVKKGKQCEANFTVKELPPPPPTPTPGVTIEKYVDTDKKYARVNANVEFSYRIVVTNTGNADLENVVVTDTPDQAITLISVSPPSGSINENTFVYTIPTLLKGESRTFSLTAKVPEAQAGRITNTVCVDAPSVPGSPDKCDKADVEIPPTPVPGKIEVCIIKEKTVRQITEDERDANPTLYTTDFSLCDEEEVVEVTELPETGPVETALSLVGAMSLVGASAYYAMSRRHV